MTSGGPSPKWLDQYLEAQKKRKAEEKEEWDKLTPEEQEERLTNVSQEKKNRSRLW
jgi:hypothetical protein